MNKRQPAENNPEKLSCRCCRLRRLCRRFMPTASGFRQMPRVSADMHFTMPELYVQGAFRFPGSRTARNRRGGPGSRPRRCSRRKKLAIALLLGGTGLIWSNEVVKNRAGALLSNFERMVFIPAWCQCTSGCSVQSSRGLV